MNAGAESGEGAALSMRHRFRRFWRYSAAVFCAAFLPTCIFVVLCSDPSGKVSFCFKFGLLWTVWCAVHALVLCLPFLLFHSRRWWQRLFAAVVPVLLVAYWVVACFSRWELYWPFNPSIDTCYASGYTDGGFARIQPGMAEAEVVAVLGEPLYKRERGDGGTYWSYTADGKSTFGDFAWLWRCVVFTNGVVKCRIAHVCYD